MRSRYSAFAMKEPEYLLDTLAREHEDHARPRETVLRELRELIGAHRYMGLQVIETSPPDQEGVARVRFRARVFHNGRDLSFTERSEFVHDGVGWRYRRGDFEP